MMPSPPATPAGRTVGPKPQSGAQKARSRDPSPMMREESGTLGGFPPKGPNPKEVHSPRDHKGRSQAVPDLLNPNKDQTSAPLGETQFLFGWGP